MAASDILFADVSKLLFSDVRDIVKLAGKDVLFDRPVPFYVDNFLDFPVGTPPPQFGLDLVASDLLWIHGIYFSRVVIGAQES